MKRSSFFLAIISFALFITLVHFFDLSLNSENLEPETTATQSPQKGTSHTETLSNALNNDQQRREKRHFKLVKFEKIDFDSESLKIEKLDSFELTLDTLEPDCRELVREVLSFLIGGKTGTIVGDDPGVIGFEPTVSDLETIRQISSVERCQHNRSIFSGRLASRASFFNLACAHLSPMDIRNHASSQSSYNAASVCVESFINLKRAALELDYRNTPISAIADDAILMQVAIQSLEEGSIGDGYERAFQALEQLKQRFPTSLRIREGLLAVSYLRSLVLQGPSHQQNFEQELKFTAQKNPNSEVYREIQLSLLRQRTDTPKLWMDFAQSLADRVPFSNVARYHLAWALYKKGRSNQSLEIIRNSVNTNSGSPSFRPHRTLEALNQNLPTDRASIDQSDPNNAFQVYVFEEALEIDFSYKIGNTLHTQTVSLRPESAYAQLALEASRKAFERELAEIGIGLPNKEFSTSP